jgi:RNA polymerase sigma-70 factor (ECF subfamily)
LPDEIVEQHELNSLIQAGISTLPSEQRVVLVLSDVQGLSYKEIAQATGLSLGTVKSRLSRGRAKLRDYLLDRGELLPGRYRLRGDTRTRQARSVGDHT